MFLKSNVQYIEELAQNALSGLPSVLCGFYTPSDICHQIACYINILWIDFVYRKAELPLILILMVRCMFICGKQRKGKERKGGDSGRVGWWIEEGSGEEEASRIALSIIAGATK